MNCPRCNHSLTPASRRDSGAKGSASAYYCENCGWGKQRPAEQQEASGQAAGVRDYSPSTWLKLAGLWGLSAALVAAPYILLLKSPVGDAGSAVFDAEAAAAKMAAALNPHYWIAAAVYIGICGLFPMPEVDRGDLGWFGGLVDNPFSFSDDLNRTKLLLLVCMIPGRIIANTLVVSYRLVRIAVAP